MSAAGVPINRDDPASMRALFDMPEGDVYLACASRAPLAKRTLQIGQQAIASKSKPWAMGAAVDEQVREAFSRLVGCTADDVALCPSTSFSLTTAAAAIVGRGMLHRGDIGLILEGQMSSNTYPWQMLQRTCGLALESVQLGSSGCWTQSVIGRLEELEAAGKRVALVAVPAFLWSDGSGPLEIAALSKVCRREGRALRTALALDLSQSLGAVPFDLREAPVDFLAASVHKWLLGSYGLSCLYVAPEWWQDERVQPLVEDEHVRAHMADADDECPFDAGLPGYPTELRRGARRLDGGGRPNPVILPMALDGMRLALELGPLFTSEKLAIVTKRIKAAAATLGLWTPRHHAPHFLGIGPGVADGCPAAPSVSEWVRDAVRFLAERRVHVSARLKVMRVAPHLYTSPQDVDIFLQVLAEFVRARRSVAASKL